MKLTFGILAHVDAGKTTFSEQVLYHAGLIRHLGGVDSKDSFMDCNEIERQRGITVFSEQAMFQKGEDTYFLIDTPGWDPGAYGDDLETPGTVSAASISVYQ